MKAKILANPKSHGKNFGVVFFDVFSHPEYESEVRIEFQRPVQSKTGLSCLVVRDCTCYLQSVDTTQEGGTVPTGMDGKVTVGGARKVVVLAWHVVALACTGDRRGVTGSAKRFEIRTLGSGSINPRTRTSPRGSGPKIHWTGL